MSAVNIAIQMDNAAFDDEPEVEVARILREAAKRFERDGIASHPLFDVNGNKVGGVEVTW